VSFHLEGGYRWFPLHDYGLVITPYLGAVTTVYRSEDPVVGNQRFKIPVAGPMAELLVGWEFGV